MNFHQEIEKLLENDEEVLWHHEYHRNLLLILPLGIFFILFWISFILIFTILGVLKSNIMVILFINVFGSIAVLLTTFEVIRTYKQRKNWENLSKEDLKNYLQFEVLTQRRLIIKDFSGTLKEFGHPTVPDRLKAEKDVLFADLGVFTSIEFYFNKVSFAIESKNSGYLLEFKIKDSKLLKLLENQVNRLFDKNIIISHI